MNRTEYLYKDFKSIGNKIIFDCQNMYRCYKDYMIFNCDIHGIIKYEDRNINTNRELIFDDLKDESLYDLLNKGIKVDNIKNLIKSIYNIKEELSKYMLDIDDICLQKEMIFIYKDDYRFIYLPNYQLDIHEQLKNLLKYILDKINYRDRELTTLSFAIFQMLESGKKIRDILGYINEFEYCSPYDIAEKEVMEIEDDIEDEADVVDNNLIQNFIKNTDKLKYIITTVPVILLIIISYILKFNEEIIAGIILIYVTIAYIIYKIFKLINSKKYVKKIKDNYNFEYNQDTEIFIGNKLVLKNKNLDIIIDKFPFLIGRESSSDYVFNKKYISKKHLKFYEEDGKIYIRDLGSKNGVFLNNIRISNDVTVKSGDVLRIAKYSFTIL